jgi:hypothetical protein
MAGRTLRADRIRPLVDNARLRAEFERRQRTEQLTPRELAARIGWQHDGDGGQGTRHVQVELGLIPHHEKGAAAYRRRLNQSTALRIAAGLHLDPVDIGV